MDGPARYSVIFYPLDINFYYTSSTPIRDSSCCIVLILDHLDPLRPAEAFWTRVINPYSPNYHLYYRHVVVIESPPICKVSLPATGSPSANLGKSVTMENLCPFKAAYPTALGLRTKEVTVWIERREGKGSGHRH